MVLNENEEWWHEYMTRIARSDYAPCADETDVIKIIVEADRRAEIRVWELAKELAKGIGIVYRNGEADIDDSLWTRAVDTKLKALKSY